MKKRSSKTVSLVLITATLVACSRTTPEQDQQIQRVYMRADQSAPYTEVTEQYQQQRQAGGSGMGMGSALLWYMAFRPLMGGTAMGYASAGLSHQSNVGTNMKKDAAAKTVQRGGFGSTAKSSTASS
ncbi:hypothetical protein [Myroides sp. LJL119]